MTATVTTRTFEISSLGRPHTANVERRLHHYASARIRKNWNEATVAAVHLHHIEPMGRIAVTVQARYHGGNLTDTDACHPSVKGVIDGLVAAGVIPDDTGEHVRSVTYLAPVLDRTLPHALIVQIEAA